MHRFILTVSIICPILLLSCSTSPELGEFSPEWKTHGLEEAAVYSIHERNGKLYAGTDRGVYISNDAEHSSWRGLVLNFEGVQYIDLALDTQKKIVAALHYLPDYFSEENPVLFESLDDGKTWKEIKATSEGATWEGQPVSSLITLRLLSAQKDNIDVLYGYNGVIHRSNDGGRNWSVIFEGGGFSSFFVLSEDHPDYIWTGGTLPIQWPYLATSDDRGETWTLLNEQVSFNAEATARTASVSPNDPDRVLVGFISNGPAIRKTTNGGQTWKTVMEDFHIYALENGQGSSGRVYASGKHPSSQLSVVVSDNYGENWTTFIFNEGPGQMQVYDMNVANIDGQEVLFLGTNRGVYSFRLEE